MPSRIAGRLCQTPRFTATPYNSPTSDFSSFNSATDASRFKPLENFSLGTLKEKGFVHLSGFEGNIFQKKGKLFAAVTGIEAREFTSCAKSSSAE